jgi:hypothetical protein
VESALADLAGDQAQAPAARYAAECALSDLAAQAEAVMRETASLAFLDT